ncbi:MAG: glucose-6-phosphate isomerase family protein [Candidatus Daviesbacteria bacterium]|nr:glucose-6-phosphate isomerase family protein [Candidatus Daviesbacteria bacterium]
MKLSVQKTLEQVKSVLISSKSTGPDPVYFVFKELEHEKWANITIIQNGKIGIEYPKTFGHYHSTNVNETYQVLAGEGVMQLNKKHINEGKWDPALVDEVYLIKAKAGDEIVITPEFGHSWSNTGDFPLITCDNWTAGHHPSDYEEVEKHHGLAYYLTEEKGKAKAIPNPNYRCSPDPIWITAEEFAKLS